MIFRQAIQIGDNVTDIMKLRCVSYATKNPPGFGIHYRLYAGLMWDYREDLTHKRIAFKGDWLCEDYDGLWHILKDEEYKQMQKGVPYDV